MPWRAEWAQDVVEYSLILAFLAVLITILFGWGGGGISGIWSVNSSNLDSAITASS